jgi:hypothetical protein
MSGFVEPVTLTGDRWVVLEPLTREHIPEIAVAAADGELGSLWFTAAPKSNAVEQWVDMRLSAQKPDQGLTFVVRRLDGTLVGRSMRKTAGWRSVTPGMWLPRDVAGSTARPSC